MQAVLWGCCNNVRQLLRYGADKNLKDSGGFEALRLANPPNQNEEEGY